MKQPIPPKAPRFDPEPPIKSPGPANTQPPAAPPAGPASPSGTPQAAMDPAQILEGVDTSRDHSSSNGAVRRKPPLVKPEKPAECDAKAVALDAIARGIAPVPVPRGGKNPKLNEWQKLRITAAEVPRYFSMPATNVGAIMGPASGGLTDVDLDCAEAVMLAPEFLPRTQSIYGRASKRKSHWLYTCKDVPDKAWIKLTDTDARVIVELRMGGGGKGTQSVWPGSVHPSGELYEWNEDGARAEVRFAELKKAVVKIAAGSLLVRHWPALGGRHDGALALGGFLSRAGWADHEVEDFVFTVALMAGSDVADKHRQTARDAADRFAKGEKVYGFPKIKEIFTEPVAIKLAELLDYKSAAVEEVAFDADPVDLWAKFEPPELPRGLLPELIENFAFDRSAVMGCDPAGLAVGALVACAASIPENIQLQPKRNDTQWRESARIWAGLIGGVSEMKSPMLGEVVDPVGKIDNRMSHDYHAAIAAWLKLPKEQRDSTPKPKQLRARLMNTTVEAAQEILKDSPNGVLLDQDELSGWFGSMDKYTGARGAQSDRAFWLQTYNGVAYSVDRVTRGSTYIEHLSVSILGFIQPEPIRKLADGGEDDGLLQRFITIGLRPAVLGGDEAPGKSTSDYSKLIGGLRNLGPPIGAVLKVPTVLTFDDGALKIRVELEQKHLELTQCRTLNRKLTSHVGKYNGIFARLCVIWHCIEHFDDAELPAIVTEDTARRVRDFLHDFLFPHTMAFYANVLGLSNDHDRLANTADYILAHGLEKITNRDVARGDKSMRGLKKHETDAIFEQLDALGWVARVPGNRPSDPPHWAVNPAVHQKFAGQAEASKKRREQDRKVIEQRVKHGKK